MTVAGLKKVLGEYPDDLVVAFRDPDGPFPHADLIRTRIAQGEDTKREKYITEEEGWIRPASGFLLFDPYL